MVSVETARVVMSRALAMLTVLVLAEAVPLGAQQQSFGPLTTEEGNSLYRLGYTPMVEGAGVVGRGKIRLDTWSGYANIFEQDSAATHDLFLDLERLINTVGVRVGVGDRLDIGARVTFETSTAGFLDQGILTYHDILHLGNANRGRFPKGRFSQRFSDAQGQLKFEAEPRTFALEEFRLSAKWSLSGGETEPSNALSIRTVLRVPTQKNRVGDERTDVGLMLLARRSLGSWHLHGMFGGTTIRTSPELEDLLRPAALFYMVGLERRLGETWSAIVQVDGGTPRFEPIGEPELDGASTNFLVGFAGVFGDEWSWDLGLQEDIPPDRPSVDFTLGLRVSRIWAR